MPSLFSISGLVLFLSCLILNVIILRSRRSKLLNSWVFFNFSVGIWGFLTFLIGNIKNEELSLFLWKLAHASVAFIPVFLFYNTILFCEIGGLRTRVRIFRFCIAQAVFFSILAFSNWNLFILGVKPFSTFFYMVGGPLYCVFFVVWLFFVLYAFYCLFEKYKISKGTKKDQIKYFFVGILFGFSGGATNFFPVFHINFYPFGNFTIPIYCVIVTYAILRYRLMDIKIAITRTGIFVLVYTLVLGIPFLTVFLWQEFLKRKLGDGWWMVPLLVSTALATLGPFVYLYVNNKAEAKILKEQKAYQNVLRNASGGMIKIKNLKKLLNLVVHVVTKTVKIKYAAIYLHDQENKQYELYSVRGNKDIKTNCQNIDAGSPLVWHLVAKREPVIAEEISLRLQDLPQKHGLAKLVEQLTSLKAAVVIPSFVEKRLIGILVLGEKKSGKLYSQDDLVVFSVLANQAALAIENAQFYDEVKRTHEQLFQAEKMATIGTMADGLSHQINNRFHALSLIAGDSLDIVKMTDVSECREDIQKAFGDLKNSLERIESNVLQGGEVVKGLLKYSRPADGGFEEIDFRDVIKGAIDMVQYKIKLKEIDLTQTYPENPPKIHANLIQLQEVFFNLIDNAYDATRDRINQLKEDGYRGRIEVTVSDGGDSLNIKVSDNGIGVKDLDRKKLFTPFFTTKATAKKGTGLGLYVIEKIISSHSGSIAVNSEYLRGTDFTIILPHTP